MTASCLQLMLPVRAAAQLATRVHRLATRVHRLATRVHRLATRVHRLATRVHRLATRVHRSATRVHRCLTQHPPQCGHCDLAELPRRHAPELRIH